jgi:hypothetical protein
MPINRSRIRYPKVVIMKEYILIAIIVSGVLLAPLASASDVTRSFSPNPVYTDSLLKVSLTVDVTGSEMIYAIKEDIPPGWAVYDERTGNATEQDMLKWLYYSNTTPAVDTVHEYILVSPNTPGSGTFNGTYIFENMSGEVEIIGDTVVDVEYGAGDLDNNDCVDLFDLVVVGGNFGKQSADPEWVPSADPNSDGIVDIYDLVIVGKNFGNDYALPLGDC